MCRAAYGPRRSLRAVLPQKTQQNKDTNLHTVNVFLMPTPYWRCDSLASSTPFTTDCCSPLGIISPRKTQKDKDTNSHIKIHICTVPHSPTRSESEVRRAGRREPRPYLSVRPEIDYRFPSRSEFTSCFSDPTRSRIRQQKYLRRPLFGPPPVRGQAKTCHDQAGFWNLIHKRMQASAQVAVVCQTPGARGRLTRLASRR